MSYDKNSFLSGVAVGRQLKGWGRAQPDEPKPRVGTILEAVPEFSAAAVVNNSIPEAITALGWVSVGAVVEFSGAATVSGGLPGTIDAQVSLGGVVEFSAAATVSGGLPGTIGAQASLEEVL